MVQEAAAQHKDSDNNQVYRIRVTIRFKHNSIQKSYVYDIQETIRGYPYFVMPREVYWYYVIEISYYLIELGSIFCAVKRSYRHLLVHGTMVCFLAEVTHVPVRHLWRMVLFKDFFVLVLHHFVTIFLMTLSYTSNHHRIGAVIVLVHDASDFWMEGAKMSKYVGKHLTAQILFVIFTVVWFITRLTYYPFWILHTVFIYLPKVHSPLSPVETVLITLLALLQVLHIYWFYLILKIAMQVTKDPSQARDCRSDSEISDIAEGQSESGESLDGLSSSRPNGLSGMKGQYDGVVKESTDSGTDAHLQRRTVRVSRAGDDIS